MNRKVLFLLSLLAALAIWAGTSRADSTIDRDDPRAVTYLGSYSGSYTGPWTGATRTFPNGAGVAIGVPDRTDDGRVGIFHNWKYLHLLRLQNSLSTEIENIEFELNSADLEAQYGRELDTAAKILSENPEISILLVGHADLTGAASHNDRLSWQRAEVVRQALVDRGASPERLSAIGVGSFYPLVSVSVPSRPNRRVEVHIRAFRPIHLDDPRTSHRDQ